MLAVLRIVGLVVAIVLGVTVTAWLVTGDPKWRALSWRIFRYAVFALVLVLLLFAGEALFHAA